MNARRQFPAVSKLPSIIEEAQPGRLAYNMAQIS